MAGEGTQERAVPHRDRGPARVGEDPCHGARDDSGKTLLDDEWYHPGRPWTIQRARRALSDALDKLDLPEYVRFHDFLRYFVSLLIASGLDLKIVQTRLRHASAKTTLGTYSHLRPDRNKTSSAAVAAVYKGGRKSWGREWLDQARQLRPQLRTRPRWGM